MILPKKGLIISGAFAIHMIPVVPARTMPIPKATTSSIQSAVSKTPNKAISMKAVGFAILAREKRKPEVTTYLSTSRERDFP